MHRGVPWWMPYNFRLVTGTGEVKLRKETLWSLEKFFFFHFEASLSCVQTPIPPILHQGEDSHAGVLMQQGGSETSTSPGSDGAKRTADPQVHREGSSPPSSTEPCKFPGLTISPYSSPRPLCLWNPGRFSLYPHSLDAKYYSFY